MTSLGELAGAHTDLRPVDVDWLHRLVGDWLLLADLSFADLVLWSRRREGAGYVALAQLRPTTGPTAIPEDLVGSVLTGRDAAKLELAWVENRICREGDPVWREDVPVRVETIPVRYGGRVIAVISRSTNLAAARAPSRLELTYLQCADEIAQMVHEGHFPLPGVPAPPDSLPRVGDGMIRLDDGGVVTYASPNALSAYRRLGLAADLAGLHLGSATAELAASTEPVDEALSAVLSGRAPRAGEVEAGGATVQLRAIPLTPGGRRVGALVLVRDTTELRRRDRQLVSKDATIREIHHRVKNNLQTVAALLRLQARRLESPEGRGALDEAVRRVAAIALVHETLSLALDETVAFDETATRVLGMVEELARPDAPVRISRRGEFGRLPAKIATPLAMVLIELAQNAVEHGLPKGGRLEIRAARDGTRELLVTVADDGVGLPPAFALERSDRLGLQIVRTLVETELRGTLGLDGARNRGTTATVRVPLGSPVEDQAD